MISLLKRLLFGAPAERESDEAELPESDDDAEQRLDAARRRLKEEIPPRED